MKKQQQHEQSDDVRLRHVAEQRRLCRGKEIQGRRPEQADRRLLGRWGSPCRCHVKGAALSREPRKNPNVQLVAKDADDVFSVRSKPSVVTLLKEKACLLSTHGAVEVQHLFHPRGDGDDIEKAMQSRCSTLQGPLRSSP